MPQVLYILSGAVFTVAVAAALGKLLLRRLGVRLYREEDHLLGFICGVPLLSLLVFLLCTLGAARKSVFLGVGIAVIALAVWSGAHRPLGERLPPLPRFWKWLFGVVFGAFTVVYFLNALAPEFSPDGTAYHLGLVYRYLLHHGFYRITDNMYANLSQGVEMLFLFAFAFGRHSAAALVHFAFLASLPLLMLSYARRRGFAAAGVCGALFTYASPVAGIDGSSAYIDVAVGVIAFAVFYLVQIWDAQRERGLLVPLGLVAGFAYAAKYTAALLIPYALAMVAWKSYRKRQAVLRPVLVVGLCALVLVLPWALKNWIWLGNPLSPFANALFPNPFVTVGFEQDYARYFRMYDMKSYRELPWAVTVDGRLSGLVGPLFLLSPVALVALGSPVGRQLLLAAVPVGITYFGNVGARFLIPVLPFVSLAMAMTFLRLKWLAPALVLAHAMVSWPSVVPRYCGNTAWRLTGIPLRQALRIVPEEVYLQRKLSVYAIARLVEREVPPGSRVLTWSSIAEAYTSRDVPVVYESARSGVLGRILWTPLIHEYPPTWQLRFRFQARPLRRIRVVQTVRGEPDYWSIGELRVFQGDRELPRDRDWRVRAWANPWTVQMAFDNNPITRWSSEQTISPGMFMEVDFGKQVTADSVLLECPHDQYKVRVKLQGMDGAGNWMPLAAAPEIRDAPPILGLRRLAAEELKLRGIDYILVLDSDFGAEDFLTRQPLWGTQLVGAASGYRLYRIL